MDYIKDWWITWKTTETTKCTVLNVIKIVLELQDMIDPSEGQELVVNTYNRWITKGAVLYFATSFEEFL